jgi:hypothetical protein
MVFRRFDMGLPGDAGGAHASQIALILASVL